MLVSVPLFGLPAKLVSKFPVGNGRIGNPLPEFTMYPFPTGIIASAPVAPFQFPKVPFVLAKIGFQKYLCCVGIKPTLKSNTGDDQYT